MIRKGSNVGSKVSNHRIRPVFEASKDREGQMNRKQNRNKIIIGVISFFKIKPPVFVHHMCKKRKSDLKVLVINY